MKVKSLIAFSALSIFLFVACQKGASSKPNFIFKTAPSTDVVAKIGDHTITEGEFVKGIESDLYEAEQKLYDLKMARIQAMLLEHFMKNDPNKKDLTNDQFLDQYIAKNLKVSNADIEKFILDRQIPKDQVNDEIKNRIVEFLTVEGKKLAVDKWIAEKTKKSPVEIFIKKPTLPVFPVVAGNSPFKGNEDAKVTIVEFSDFQCPFCSKGAKVLSDLEKKYGSKVKIVFKQYPLPFHSQAKIAAEASLCANEQSTKLFWKLHDAMFADQAKLDRQNLIDSAKKVGVKEKDFIACLDSGKFKAVVEAEITEGQNLGVKSTPTFFINGKLISGAQPLEVFTEIIDEDLSK